VARDKKEDGDATPIVCGTRARHANPWQSVRPPLPLTPASLTAASAYYSLETPRHHTTAVQYSTVQRTTHTCAGLGDGRHVAKHTCELGIRQACARLLFRARAVLTGVIMLHVDEWKTAQPRGATSNVAPGQTALWQNVRWGCGAHGRSCLQRTDSPNKPPAASPPLPR